jgi:histidinol-phosphatase
VTEGAAVDPAPLRDFALELADVADAISLDHFGGPIPSVAKPDGTPVTEADRAIEAALRERIEHTFPDHGLLGEETGGRLVPGVPTWVIDPIDATKNFLRGIPVFATLIGVAIGEQVIVGVASAPALGERWDAARGQGARRNGERVGVSRVGTLAEAHVLHGGLDWYRTDPRMWDLLGRLADTAWRTRGFGDYWNHLLVAGGMAEVAFESDLKPWDIAAVECIVTEAGGRMTGFDGRPALTAGDVLTTNGVLHPVMQELLAELSAPRGEG